MRNIVRFRFCQHTNAIAKSARYQNSNEGDDMNSSSGLTGSPFGQWSRRRLISQAGLLSMAVVPGFGMSKSLFAAEPTLIKASLKTYTHPHGDDKDHDTGVFVVVTEADEKTVLAHIEDADCTGQYGYANNETHYINMQAFKPGIEKSQCLNFRYKIGIMARGNSLLGNDKLKVTISGLLPDNEPLISLQGGNDRWNFDAWLTLYFSDNSTLPSTPWTGGSGATGAVHADKINQELNSTGGKLVWLNF